MVSVDAVTIDTYWTKFFLKQFLWLLKTFVLSVVLNIMVDKGSLLRCVVVVVVVIRK